MLPSQAFAKKARQRILANPGNEARAFDEILGLFEAFLPDMSRELRGEFFHLYRDRFQEREDATLFDFVEWFGPVIDLFRGHVEGLSDDFTDEEWELIKMAIDEGADTMDIRLLNALARYLVQHKRY